LVKFDTLVFWTVKSKRHFDFHRSTGWFTEITIKNKGINCSNITFLDHPVLVIAFLYFFRYWIWML